MRLTTQVPNHQDQNHRQNYLSCRRSGWLGHVLVDEMLLQVLEWGGEGRGLID